MQLTTDGLRVYFDAVEGEFGADVDYAMLVKLYESTQEETRYSPAECTGCEHKTIMGKPDPKHISTSYVERQNLTMRMQIRRFTRLTNAFSKKVENHAYHVALHYMHYNFCRIHKTLRVTLAMEAGLTDHVWTIEETLLSLEYNAPITITVEDRRTNMSFSSWWSFTQGMVNSDREEGGVYEFGDANEVVIYIGSSNNVKRRLGEHLGETDSCIKRNASKYRIEYTSDYKAREKELYDAYVKANGKAPRCNDVSPTG